MRIYHIAALSEWEQAQRDGAYTTSTLGRSLEEEGFLHAARREQVPGVWSRYYSGVRRPFVLLTIDTDKLTSPWREDPVGDETYPHIYGPLNPDAVIRAERLSKRGGTEPFTIIFLRLVAVRIAVLLVAMLCGALGVWLGQDLGEWGPFLGGVAGVVVGGVGFWFLVQRRVE